MSYYGAGMNLELKWVEKTNYMPFILLKDGKFVNAYVDYPTAVVDMEKEIRNNPTSLIILVKRVAQSVPIPRTSVEIEFYD